MRISILTTVTNPKERQDKFKEAFECYKDLADELVVVDGSNLSSKDGRIDILSDRTKMVYLHWPQEWNWVQLPKSLNAGREQCTGDWILKLDVDQFIHEKDFKEIRKRLSQCPKNAEALTFQKMSMTYGKKYYEKGGQPIAFRNLPEIVIGKATDKETDLCFAIRQSGIEKTLSYDLPIGRSLIEERTGVSYWNYDYFFKTKEFTKKEFWRFSRAYHRYFKSWEFGKDEDASFELFLNMQKSRHDKALYTYKLEDHPKYIREAVKNLTPEQFGYNGFGFI